MPGGGWTISQITTETISTPTQSPFKLNRAIIQQGAERQLVYYWYQQRGREITDEWTVKYYVIADALTKHRTDGALVRLITPIYPTENEADADKRLQEFTRILLPSLSGYLPADPGSKMKPAMTPANGNHPS